MFTLNVSVGVHIKANEKIAVQHTGTIVRFTVPENNRNIR
jgi:hypothetical protein